MACEFPENEKNIVSHLSNYVYQVETNCLSIFYRAIIIANGV